MGKSKVLSPEKIKHLLELADKRKKRGFLIDDVVAVYEYLLDYEKENGYPHPGPVYAIAVAIQIPESAVSRALSEMKSDKWKKATGCTVPWQPRGVGEKSYSIVHSDKNLPLLNKGNKIRREYNRVDAARLYSHYELQRDLETNPINKEWWKLMIFHLKQVLEVYEQMAIRDEEMAQLN